MATETVPWIIKTNLLKELVVHSFQDRPSFIHYVGSVSWHKDGLAHRENGNPAYINHMGDFDIRLEGKLIQGFQKLKDGGYKQNYPAEMVCNITGQKLEPENG